MVLDYTLKTFKTILSILQWYTAMITNRTFLSLFKHGVHFGPAIKLKIYSGEVFLSTLYFILKEGIGYPAYCTILYII